MFTGIITDIGEINSIDGSQYAISCSYDLETVDLGASIAVNGVCLTVTKKAQNTFFVDISPETLGVTTANKWQEGMKVNLERALKVGDELGGHWVQGHVDGVIKVLDISQKDDVQVWRCELPKPHAHLIAKKGSITTDGVSLTVNDVGSNDFSLCLIPHTIENTTLQFCDVGSILNYECDVVARYLERLRI